MSTPNQRIGLYPGTFDPVTHGHIDIIERALRLCDKLIVGVAGNQPKGPLFSLAERVGMIEADVAPLRDKGAAIEVRPFENLLVHFAVSVDASVIIRGLRSVPDFESEYQMASVNAQLNPKIQTIFLMAASQHQAISSHNVKEIARLGGDIGKFVSPHVASRLAGKFTLKA